MCKIDPNIGEVWKIENSSLTKKKLFDFSCKKSKITFIEGDIGPALYCGFYLHLHLNHLSSFLYSCP